MRPPLDLDPVVQIGVSIFPYEGGLHSIRCLQTNGVPVDYEHVPVQQDHLVASSSFLQPEQWYLSMDQGRLRISQCMQGSHLK